MSRRHFLILLGFIAVSHLAGVVGSFFTGASFESWYPALQKPDLVPPSWAFGVVWPLLYTFMGISAYLVWQKKGMGTALVLFGVQLVLNAFWSILFFGMQSPVLGLVCVVALWIAILVTSVAFWRIERWAGVLFVPYLLWVSFATYLNYAIWMLN